MAVSSWLRSLSRQCARSQPSRAWTPRFAEFECLEPRLPLTLGAIADQVISEDSTTSLTFSIADDSTAAADLVVSVSVAESDIVAPDGLQLSGDGATRSLQITPIQQRFGETVITVAVGRAGELPELVSFRLTVAPLNDLPIVSEIANQTLVIGTPTPALSFTVNDLETPSDLLAVTATSSNTALVPDANITLSETEFGRSITVTPVAQLSGSAVITLSVTDADGGRTQVSFTVNVSPASLTYDLSNDDTLFIASNGNSVTAIINGELDLRYAGLTTDRIGAITVIGGAGANLIDLQGIVASSFPILTSIRVEGGDGDDILRGSPLADRLFGGAGNDQLEGGLGTDTLTGDTGSDTLIGGAGLDQLVEAGDFNIVLGASSLSMSLPDGTGLMVDQFSGIELADITGGVSANRIDARGFVAIAGGVTQINASGGRNTVLGTAGRDAIYAYSQNDLIYSLGGNDSIYAGSGDDTIDAGEGNDLVLGQLGNDVVYGGAGNDGLLGGDGFDSLFGDGGNDRIFGLRDNDLLSGGLGDDSLYGDTGNDVLRGNDGADWLNGGIGNDVLDGGADLDRVLEMSDTTFLVTPNHISCPALGVKTLIDVDRIQITGGISNNVIDATTANVPLILIGGGGDDTLLGGQRTDIILGGDGNDVLVSGGGKDVLDAGPGENFIATRIPRIAVLGDSTVATFLAPLNGEPAAEGWGQALDEYYQRTGAAVVNHAVSGRSLKSFRLEGRWQPVVESHPDVVLIQFGHNDRVFNGPLRGSDPNGEFQDILKSYIAEARAVGTVPILVTPVSARGFVDGVLLETVTVTPYANAMRQVAQETGVALIDLNQTSFALYQQLGAAGSEFMSRTPTDIAHFSPAGALLIANLVARDLSSVMPQTLPWMTA